MTGFRPSNSSKQDCRWRNARLQGTLRLDYDAPKSTKRFQDSGELAASNVTSSFGSLQRYLPLARISCDFSAKTI